MRSACPDRPHAEISISVTSGGWWAWRVRADANVECGIVPSLDEAMRGVRDAIEAVASVTILQGDAQGDATHA